MQLTISTEEAQALREALDVYLPELDFELARTEKHPLEHVLRVRYDRLVALRDRVSAAQAAGDLSPDLAGEANTLL